MNRREALGVFATTPLVARRTEPPAATRETDATPDVVLGTMPLGFSGRRRIPEQFAFVGTALIGNIREVVLTKPALQKAKKLRSGSTRHVERSERRVHPAVRPLAGLER